MNIQLTTNHTNSWASRLNGAFAHMPSAKAVAIVALKVLAAIGVIAFSIYFPFTAMALSIASYAAFRIFMEYSQYKFDQYFDKQGLAHSETHVNEHARMLQAVKVMHAIATNRHFAQVVSLAAILAFWHVKAPLVILAAAATAAVVAFDIADSRACVKALKRQLAARIYNNPASNQAEIARMRVAYRGEPPQQIVQRCHLEADCRRLRLEYQHLIDGFSAQAYAYLLKSKFCSIEEGASDPDIIIPLCQLSVVFEIESRVDRTKFAASPLLRKHFENLDEANTAYSNLTKKERSRLKERLMYPDDFKDGTDAEDDAYRKVCAICRLQVNEVSFFKGAEMHHLRKLRLDRYLKSKAADIAALLLRPGEPRSSATTNG